MKPYSRIVALPLAVLTVALVGCGGGDGDTPQGRVRVINALAGNATQPVDVLIHGQRVFSNVAYGTNTQSATVDALQNSSVNVVAAGTTNSIVQNNGVNIQPNIDQTIVITGLPGATGAQALQVNAFSRDDLSNPPTQGQVRFYFINAAPEATTADFSYSIDNGAFATNADLTAVPYLQKTGEQLPTFGNTVFRAVVGGQTVETTPILTTGQKTYIIVLTGRTGAGTPALGLQVFPQT
jgi:hypothetical protein